MEISKNKSDEKPKNLWKDADDKYQVKQFNFIIINYNIIKF